MPAKATAIFFVPVSALKINTILIIMLKIYKLLLAIVLPFILVQTVAAQSVKISGVVTAKSDGLPLPGVSVSVKGTTTGAQTNVDG